MTFEEWWDKYLFLGDDLDKELAKAAWDAAVEQDVWKQALDHELLTWDMATPKNATFEQALKKLRILLNITQSVAVDPSVNGGYVLVPVEPTEKMIDAGLMFHRQFSSSISHVYKAMIQAAKEKE